MTKLTKEGSKVFWAHEAWLNHCAKENIDDPWVLMRACEDKVNKHWAETDEKGHTTWYANIVSQDKWPKDVLDEYNHLKKYRDQYIMDRELWEANYILENYGFKTLEYFGQLHDNNTPYDIAVQDWIKKQYPCTGTEGQCNFSCPVFHNCPYQEQGIK